MSRYQMEDGKIVDTDKAAASWKENTRWNGNNHISKATGSQWHHQELHRSSRGRYYIESWSQYQGSTPGACWVTDEEAARWLLANDHLPTEDDFPEDLKKHVDDIVE